MSSGLEINPRITTDGSRENRSLTLFLKSYALNQSRFTKQLSEHSDGGGIAGFGFSVVRKRYQLYPAPPELPACRDRGTASARQGLRAWASNGFVEQPKALTIPPPALLTEGRTVMTKQATSSKRKRLRRFTPLLHNKVQISREPCSTYVT